MDNLLSFLLLVFGFSTPFVFASMAGYASERGGLINIALEGKMLMAAFSGAIGTQFLGIAGGAFCAIAAATLLSLLHWVFTHTYRMDQIISGMAINLLALGVTGFIKVPDKTASGLNLNLLTGAGLAFAFFMNWMASSTRFGLQHRGVGSDPDKSRLLGLNPPRIRAASMILTGIGCGLAGYTLFANVNLFTDNMSAGKGYISLAALILGGWRPLPTLGACLMFGLAAQIDFTLRGKTIGGVTIPSEFMSMIPYLVTVIALAGFLGKNRTPAGLGKI